MESALEAKLLQLASKNTSSTAVIGCAAARQQRDAARAACDARVATLERAVGELLGALDAETHRLLLKWRRESEEARQRFEAQAMEEHAAEDIKHFRPTTVRLPAARSVPLGLADGGHAALRGRAGR